MTELFILPFDHRGSFMKIIGASSTPTEADIAKAREYKRIIFDAFKKSVEEGVPKDKAGVLVDEWLGSEILSEAKRIGFITATPFEKSGQDEFDFEFPNWKEKVEELDPTYVKVLVRYNVEGDAGMNERQAARLAELGEYLSDRENRFLFELLVPATAEQMEQAGGDNDKYEQEIRPSLMVAAIKELQDSGVNPDVWKLEGLDSTEKMQAVGDQVMEGNPEAGIIILGRGESAEKAEHWLKMGAKVGNAIGFAVGRTVFKDALSEYAAGKISRQDAVKKISDNYSFFVKVWQKVKAEE